ncbi:DUF1045 domain-containing protein [Bradyrhizobium commune]|uniref:DUF1045 domain-containing protein n=1 Tax=Bradyrhizobium commune TaxID=83627 RepID=A0A7S9D425_9BRAD|nr:DUF1045 domain-containing protein [Bradyrhizobium commune]QPF90803.1 DUF1045 domain-containing protein [Bradyrhizobium commune]
MPESFSPRYAIYYTPAPDHPLTVAARAWLGRDSFAGGAHRAHVESVAADPVRGTLTAAPRHYGFHATLMAPFRLRQDRTVEELERALRTFAAAWPPCPIGPLKIDMLGSFFALVPVSSIPTLHGFASHIVEEFDRFRAPLTQDEFQRRLRSPLDDIETTQLVRWGYPYVFDRFRFHMTLTDQVPAERRADVREELDAIFGPLLLEDYAIDALSLFTQERPSADFVVRSQFVLGSRALLKEAV